MTLTVNGQPADPGCYVEGHWGQYAGGHLRDRAHEFRGTADFDMKLDQIEAEWPKNEDGSLCGAYGSDRDADEGKGTGPWAAIQNFGDTDGQIAMELADEVLELLNSVTEGGYWGWYDGECFLRSYVCSECGRDARNPTATKMGYSPNEPDDETCPFCCDADDPGCFA